MNNTQIEKMVNYFTTKSNTTEQMPINYFCNKIYLNCGIDSNEDENQFIRKYLSNEYIIKSGYRDLINEIINSKDGINKIEKIIKYFNISEYIEYSNITLTSKTIQMISIFISGKLVQYNARDNLIKFNKYLLKYFPEEFDIKELEFTYKLVDNFSEKYYFVILDDLLGSNSSIKLKLNNTINQLLVKYEGGKAFMKDYNIKNEIEIVKNEIENNNINIKGEKNIKIDFNKLSKFFSGGLPNSEKIKISDFINLLENINIVEPFLAKYKVKYGNIKSDYIKLFEELYQSQDGEEKINKILDYFELSKYFIIEKDYSIAIEENINQSDNDKDTEEKDIEKIKQEKEEILEKKELTKKRNIFGFIKNILTKK